MSAKATKQTLFIAFLDPKMLLKTRKSYIKREFLTELISLAVKVRKWKVSLSRPLPHRHAVRKHNTSGSAIEVILIVNILAAFCFVFYCGKYLRPQNRPSNHLKCCIRLRAIRCTSCCC